MSNTIVTHISADLDAITSCWLIKRYFPGWKEADIAFVPAGTTLNNEPPDANPAIIHVDTGFGMFDHHQNNERTCAAEKVFLHAVSEGYIQGKDRTALERFLKLVVLIDRFEEINFPDPADDRYELCIYQIIDHLQGICKSDTEIIALISVILDAELRLFHKKIQAEDEISKGYIFTSLFGKALIMETSNETSMKLAMKKGYKLVVRKDPTTGSVRIKTIPDPSIDLTGIYNKIIKKDPIGTWFLHASTHMLLNGSSRNPTLKPTPLTIKDIIAILQ